MRKGAAHAGLCLNLCGTKMVMQFNCVSMGNAGVNQLDVLDCIVSHVN